MKIKKGFAIILMILIFNNCQQDDEIIFENELISINDLKIALYEARDSDDPIIKILETTDQNYYEIVFESNRKILVKQHFIDSIVENKDHWNVTFYYSDGSLQETTLLGDHIDFEEKDLLINPYYNAPLTALVKIMTPVNGKFRVKVLGKGENGISIEKAFETFGKYHEIPVLGLYPAYKNEVEFTFLNEAGQERFSQIVNINTDPIDIDPVIDIVHNNLPPNESSIYFVADLKMGFDQRGEIRYYYQGDAQFLLRKMENGHLLITSDEDKVIYHSPAFYEVSMLGQIIKKYNVVNLLHHEVRSIPNGNFLVAGNGTPFNPGNDGHPEEDVVLELDRNTGEVVNEWDFKEILDPLRKTLPSSRAEDWFHINSIFFDESDQSLIVSGRNQSAVVKVAYPSGNLLWILADPHDWSAELSEYLLQPVGDDGSALDTSEMDFWPYGQHTAQALPNGNLLLYDNGDFRGYYKNNSASPDSYSRAVEYKINKEKQTIQLIRQHDYDKGIFTKFTGDVDYLPETGNRLIGFMRGTGFGNIPKILEVDQDNNILFDVNINPGANYYRAEKMDLYKGIKSNTINSDQELSYYQH